MGLGNNFAPDSVDTFDLDLADVGDLYAIKIYNTGTDGWMLDDISLDVGGTSYAWTYGQVLDGDGNGDITHSVYFYAANGLITTFTLHSSSLENADTSDDVTIFVTGTGGSSGVATFAGVAARSELVSSVSHPDLGDFISATIAVAGNNGVNL